MHRPIQNTGKTLVYLTILIALSSITPSASAWGSFARENFCRQTLDSVWGEYQMFTCIPPGEYENKVTEKIRALYPLDNYSRDFTSCPVVRGDDSKWVCGNKSLNPTGFIAGVWFNKSRDSQTICERIIDYCIAVDFYANQFHPLHHTKYVLQRYEDSFNEKIDERMRSGDTNWSVRQMVIFEHYEQLTGRSRKARYYQDFTVDSSVVAKLMDDLYNKAYRIKTHELATTSTIIPYVKPEVNVRALPETLVEPPTQKLKPRKTITSKRMVFPILSLLLVFLIWHAYQNYRKKPVTAADIETNLWKLPGITGEVVEKLVSVGLESIQTFMAAPPGEIAKKTGLLPADIKNLKQAQRKAFRNCFIRECPLSMDDLTPKQHDEIIRHKKNIDKMMKVYRHREKLSKKKLADLEEILAPLNQDEKKQVQRIIDGTVQHDEDLPYRILVTSAEIDLGKLTPKT